MKNTQTLLNLMRDLRHPESGCPWDIEQDFASIAPHTIEEAYEVADAIARNDNEAIKDELGDLLLQVVFLSQIADENSLFAFEDVAKAISDKLIRRHPHIFGEAEKIQTSAEQTEAWEKIKQQERAQKSSSSGTTTSILADVPTNLPALLRASKLQKRASKAGFDWEHIEQIFAKLEEEVKELRAAIESSKNEDIQDELGDMLFVMANLANRLNINPETALRGANAKFERRFNYIEEQLVARNKRFEDSNLAEMDSFWDEAKTKEKIG